MIVFPNAKINLGLHVTEKRPDGYHNLETVFYPIPLTDALEVTLGEQSQDQKCILHEFGQSSDCPAEKNLVVKAYHLLNADFHLPSVNVYLYKHIPSGAGLGGGSSDAAFMLKLLNEMFNLLLTPTQLEGYAIKLGADCPFFIRNSPTLAEGVGNIFSPITLSLKGYILYVVKPSVFVSTQTAFSHVTPQKPNTPLAEVVAQTVSEWKASLKNDFEQSVFLHFPQIEHIKRQLYESGARYASMSGSGSAVYGVFEGEVQEIEGLFADSQVFKCKL